MSQRMPRWSEKQGLTIDHLGPPVHAPLMVLKVLTGSALLITLFAAALPPVRAVILALG